jgi:hypothetical protein
MKLKYLGAMIATALFLCIFTLSGLAQALAGGAVEGTITDHSGAIIPGATLTLRNPSTGILYTSTSNQSGSYNFPVVAVGQYELTADKDGFTPIRRTGLSITVGSKQHLPLVFQVAGVSETIEVSNEAPIVETTRTSIASTVNEKAIEALPVNGRNFIDFALLTPGVTRDSRSGDLSFAGQRGTLNSLTVDGTDDNNSFYGQSAARSGFKTPYQFSQDSVQEFQVATNGYSAEIGRAGGAVINVVTKSGTNTLHGDLFEFYRDQSLNAYDPMQKLNFLVSPSNAGKSVPVKSKYHYNQFGGDVGGPIWKNRAFFYFDLDDQRNTQPNIISSYSTPASPNAEQAAAINYLASRNASYNKTNNQNTYLIKTDVILNQKNLLGARWNRQRFTAGEQENAGTTSSLEHTGNSYIHTDNANLSLTSTLSPKLTNVVRLAYLKDREPGSANSNNAEATVKQGGTTLLAVGRNDFSPRETTVNQMQYSDSLTLAINRQTIKFGGDLLVAKIKNFFPGNFYGNYTFNSLLDFGCSLLSESVGTVTTNGTCATATYIQAFSGAGTSGPTTHPDTLMPDFFVQDDIRLLNNLTVNIGLRYDDQSNKNSGIVNATALVNGYNTSKQSIANNEWSPRFGFAWSPNAKFVVRGGYGLFYGTTNSMLLATAMSNNGINVSNYSYSGSAVPFYPNTLCGAPGSALCSAPTGGSSSAPTIYVVAGNFQNPVVQQANLNVEYQLASDLSVSIGALRAKGDHLQRTADQNLSGLTTASISDNNGNSYSYLKYSATRPVSAFTRISLFQSNADSTYNGLIAQLNKRFSRRLQGSLGYTWSHVLDNAPDATSVVVGNSGDDAKIAMYPTMPWLDRGNGGSDVRHRLTLSYVAQLGIGNAMPHAAALILKGWSTSGILTVQSGMPYSAMISGNFLNEGNSYNNRLPGTGRNQYRMPTTWSFDPRLSREIALCSHAQKTRLQVFAEGFNLFNHFNITSVKNNAYTLNTTTNTLIQQTPAASSTAYFGLPNQSSPSQRIIQLGAKIIF